MPIDTQAAFKLVLGDNRNVCTVRLVAVAGLTIRPNDNFLPPGDVSLADQVLSDRLGRWTSGQAADDFGAQQG
jgi:hypothetical protein